MCVCVLDAQDALLVVVVIMNEIITKIIFCSNKKHTQVALIGQSEADAPSLLPVG